MKGALLRVTQLQKNLWPGMCSGPLSSPFSDCSWLCGALFCIHVYLLDLQLMSYGTYRAATTNASPQSTTVETDTTLARHSSSPSVRHHSRVSIDSLHSIRLIHSLTGCQAGFILASRSNLLHYSFYLCRFMLGKLMRRSRLRPNLSQPDQNKSKME